MNNLKKVLTFGVVLATIVWSMGLAALVPVAGAATLTAGDVIKGSYDAVYFYAADGNRYVYPQDKYYFTWQYDFSVVKAVTDGELAAVPLAGNVVTRYGTKLLKIQSIPKVYAPGPDGALYWLNSEAVAISMFGADWGSRVTDVQDSFWPNYSDTGVELDGTWYPDGFLLKAAGSSDVYFIWGGMKSRIASEAAFYANRFYWEYVCETTQSVLDSYTDGADITGADSKLIDDSQSGIIPPTPAGDQNLTITIAPDTPSSTSVPAGATPATDIWFTRLHLTAGDKDVSVNKIYIHRAGLSVDADLAGVKLFYGATQLSTSQTFNADHKAQFNLSTGELTVPANTTLVLDVMGDNAANRTGIVKLGIELASDVEIDGTVHGSFAMYGDEMTQVMGTPVGQLTLADGASQPTAGGAVDIDELNHRFFQVKLTANGVEQINVHSLILQKGNAATFLDGDLDNIYLYNDTDGVKLADGVWSSDKLVFDFASILAIGQGGNKELSLMSDVVGGSGRLVGFDLHDGVSWLVQAVGDSYGYGVSYAPVSPIATGWASAVTGQGPLTTINQGTMNVSKDLTSPATGNIPIGGTEIPVATFKFAVQGEEIRVGSSGLVLTHSSGADATAVAEVSNVRLVDGSGKVIAGPTNPVADAVNDGVVLVGYTSSYTLPTGDNLLTVMYDVASTSIAAGTVRVDTDWSAFANVRGLTSNRNITPTPGVDVLANTMTFQGPALAADFGATPVASNVILGSVDYIFGYIDLDATAGGEDVKVTQIVINEVDGSGVVATDYANCKLTDTATDLRVGDVEQPAGGAGATVTTFALTNAYVVSQAVVSTLAYSCDLLTTVTGTAMSFNMTASAAGNSVDINTSGATTGSTVTETVVGTASPTQTFQASGSLRVVLAALTPVAEQLVASSGGNDIVEYELLAIDEDVDVTQINLFFGNTAGGGVAAVNADSNMNKVYAYVDGVKVGEGVMDVSGYVTINITSGKFVVGTIDESVLSIKVDMRDKLQLATGVAAGTGMFQAGIADATNNNDAAWGGADSYDMTAVGVSSGATIVNMNSTAAGGGLVFGGNLFTVHDGILQVELNSSSPSGTASPGTGQTLFVFNLKAVNDKVTVDAMELVPSETIVAALPNADGDVQVQDLSNTVYGSGLNANGDAADTVVIFSPAGTPWTIVPTISASGTLVLKYVGNTTGAATNETLQISIKPSALTSGISYSAQDGTNVDLTTTDGLPLDGNVLQF